MAFFYPLVAFTVYIHWLNPLFISILPLLVRIFPHLMAILKTVKTECSSIDVCRCQDGAIEFRVTGAAHAWWHPRLHLTEYVWDAIAAAVLFHPAQQPRSLLMLGLGGGTALRTLRCLLPDLKITAVEIDPGMIALAREYMALDELEIEVVQGDAYQFITGHGKTYDVVFDDVYRSGVSDVERPKPFNAPLAKQLQKLVDPTGIFALNLCLGVGHRKQQSWARNIFATHFQESRVVKPWLGANEVLIGGAQLGPISAVRSAGARFPESEDQLNWRKIQSRKLT